MQDRKEPTAIESTYRVIGEGAPRPRPQPIFNHWRNAVPLLALLGLRALWVLAVKGAEHPWLPGPIATAIGYAVLGLFIVAVLSPYFRNRRLKKLRDAAARLATDDYRRSR